ncbi:MAG: DUF1501 domain-containing protein [Fuerstiella sp.]|nr:DUF1501 domain-containing protein [Fuerstiella sp.]MCP4859429.1 DUF1501 domain-containing protein [Fuerstiella sp.]
MTLTEETVHQETRRHFLASNGIGAAALTCLLRNSSAAAADRTGQRDEDGGLESLRSLAPTAKRVIYLFQSGGLSQLDLYDYKPHLKDQLGRDLPASVRMGQRLTGFTKDQKKLPIVPSKFRYRQHGESGLWLSELLPHLGRQADDICLINSVHTEAINHDPARTLLQTGVQLAGRPCTGSWVTYGLGSPCHDLPAFMVLTSIGSCKRTPQPVSSRLWGSGFLPSQYQGVKLQSTGDPILCVSNPPGLTEHIQSRTLNALSRLNDLRSNQSGDPEIHARTQQYEMAFRMQMSVPELTSTDDEPKETFELYGDDARRRGTFAANCLMARRMAERGVRFIQLYHVGWDHHKDIPRDLPLMCRDTDQPAAALVADLKRRGMLDDTLVVWGSEFGRTVFSQGAVTKGVYGRDHHGRCFTFWMAGGGIKGGITHGKTDDFGYSIAEHPVHPHDLNATILHCLGVDHRHLSVNFQGLDARLTGVEDHNPIRDILL